MRFSSVVKPVMALSMVMVFAAACTSSPGTKETVGTVGGAAVGAVLGSQIGGGSGRIVATALGTLGGALIGNEIGRSLDRADKIAMTNAAGDALENNRIGEASTWSNPDSGNSGRITPTRTWQRDNGTYCREYSNVVIIDGREEVLTGTACRQDDGTWKDA